MAVFICGLNPNGVASKSGMLQVGDELLEVIQLQTNFQIFIYISQICEIDTFVYKLNNASYKISKYSCIIFLNLKFVFNCH